MDGYYNNNGSNFNYSGYSQRPSNNNFGSCSNCPGGICPRNSDQDKGQNRNQSQSQGQGQTQTKAQGQGQGMIGQRGCPGGNCCLGGHCSIGQSGSNLNWQNYGR
ncbi:homeobox protein 9 [Drosophila serrata]|uniref:homeobox protein 9 n=1 Tax=Drosophila serrata TaxID=7274 RepID=UPI000A1D1C51|nr:homeobox protein 9 [Drosophila serrata]KAH8391403.1 hypothetical protein KR200_005417 [Drosophila serrata]